MDLSGLMEGSVRSVRGFSSSSTCAGFSRTGSFLPPNKRRLHFGHLVRTRAQHRAALGGRQAGEALIDEVEDLRIEIIAIRRMRDFDRSKATTHDRMVKKLGGKAK